MWIQTCLAPVCLSPLTAKTLLALSIVELFGVRRMWSWSRSCLFRPQSICHMPNRHLLTHQPICQAHWFGYSSSQHFQTLSQAQCKTMYLWGERVPMAYRPLLVISGKCQMNYSYLCILYLNYYWWSTTQISGCIYIGIYCPFLSIRVCCCWQGMCAFFPPYLADSIQFQTCGSPSEPHLHTPSERGRCGQGGVSLGSPGQKKHWASRWAGHSCAR